MNYLDTLEDLKTSPSVEMFVNIVNANVEDCIAEQTLDNTNRYRAFMLTNQAELNVRLQGLTDYLAKGKPKAKTHPNERGVVAGYRLQDNSKGMIDHLILGIPGIFAIHLITKIDLVQGKLTLEGAYGCFLNDVYMHQAGNPKNRITRTSTLEKTLELLEWLTKLGLSQTVEEAKPDPEDSIKHVQKVYEEQWGGDTKPNKGIA